MRWTGLTAGAPIGHAEGGGPIVVNRIEGPVAPTGPNSFRLQFYRGSTFDKPIAWFAATHPGDDKYKSAVQQADMNIAPNKAGREQTISFDSIGDVPAGNATVKLVAESSAKLPVRFYVREGPVQLDGNTLHLLTIPPRAKLPIAVTVVAWQFGRGGADSVKTATPVEQTFRITR
jgi:hypothetical protein